MQASKPEKGSIAIDVLTIFPDLFKSFLDCSLVGKARERGLLEISLIDIRDFADPPHYSVDDSPYGGGAGMIMRPEPLAKAIRSSKLRHPEAPVLLMTPSGRLYNQAMARELSQRREIILVCGRYEGVDQRVIDRYVDFELSIGDYVLMGGEVPAMAVIESTLRLVDSVLGNADSIVNESFSVDQKGRTLLEAPHYTRPAEFEGAKVPEELLSGNHKLIEEWRHAKAIERTSRRRPDLLEEP